MNLRNDTCEEEEEEKKGPGPKKDKMFFLLRNCGGSMGLSDVLTDQIVFFLFSMRPLLPKR